MPAADELKRSPLDGRHRDLGARMVPFGGWDMPVSYPSGTVQEHLACRSAAVAFDVSHLGTVHVPAGDVSFAALNDALTNDLGRIAPGQAQYTHLLDDTDASVLDDIIVWWRPDGSFDVMPNASNTARVLDALGLGDDVTATRAIVAIQGPDARACVGRVAPDAAAVGRFRVAEFSFGGVSCTVAGTGYTGEDGVECAVPSEVAGQFWDAILASGAQPAGLGARDTLRLEAGLPLHGHELGPGTTPLQAGLGWVVAWDKPRFRGRVPLLAEKERGIGRRLRGLTTEGRQPPREGYAVRSTEGREVGAVTSGNYSPVLGHGIAMAFLPPDMEPGSSVHVDMRGKAAPASVVKLPFVEKKKGS